MDHRFAPSLVLVLAALTGAPHLSPALAAQASHNRTEAASLLEQALFAEEHKRDFAAALDLFERARAAAAAAKDAATEASARQGADRVRARNAGVAQTPTPQLALQLRIADLILNYRRSPEGTSSQHEAANEVAIFGASAVDLIERGVAGPVRLEGADGTVVELPQSTESYVMLLARMTVPEAGAALDRLLSASDPLVRRSVATHANPDRHRAQLLRALKDPAPQVVDRAITRLAGSNDPALADVMRSAALKDNETAMAWLLNNARASQLVDMIADENLPANARTRACTVLAGAKGGQASKAALDAIFSLIRDLAEESSRQAAMESLFKLVTETWSRIPPELLRQLEDTLRTDSDRIPQPLGDRLLHRIGTARSLPYLVERHFSTSNQSLRLPDPNSLLARCGVGDFVQVSAALGLVPAREPRQDVFGSAMFQWLRGAAVSKVGSADLMQGLALQSANSRGPFLQDVAAQWIVSQLPERGDLSAAQRAAVGPELAPLAEELFESVADFSHGAGIRLMGAVGDPRYVRRLFERARTANSSECLTAIRRILAQQPARAADAIGFLLSSESTWEGDSFSSVFSGIFPAQAPEQLLKLAVDAWGNHTSASAHRRLIYLVAEQVPGDAGDQFLMQHYRELDVTASDARRATLLRFASSLYPPGVELIQQALRDPSSQVREAANTAFQAYRSQARVLDEFDAWANRAAQRDSAVHEFTMQVQGTNPDVVGVAALALGSLRVQSARPLIEQALQRFESNAALAVTLRRALEMLGN